jgi:murein L,D-transpeptidase YcbB/YkuD
MTSWRKIRVGMLVIGVLVLVCNGRSTRPSEALSHSPRGVGQLPVADVANAIRAIVHDSPVSTLQLTSATRRELTALYQASGYRALWVDGSGRPTGDARDTLGLLTGAAREGLDPADYRASMLDSSATALERTDPPTASSIAAFDAGLSASTLRYLRHLHIGRVDPRSIGFRMTAPADDHDFAVMLRSAVLNHRIPELAAGLAPPLALYRNLRTLLVRYRELSGDATLQSAPVPARVVRPGDAFPEASSLLRLLTALGDLPGETPASAEPSVYAEAVVNSVKRFQVRHGLDADGIIGARTETALRVPLAWRVRQIELALERLRWLPHLNQDRFLAVNIPMFRLWAWDSIPPNGAPSFGMDVIVGRGLNRQTPVFVEEIEYLIFRPYWDVPSSILRGEILPAVRREPGYLQRHDMEIVSGVGDDARAVSLTEESLAQLQQGRLRVRQRPGPRNSLGSVKFIFPNDANVYLHDTPAPELFSRSRRDFSHGCVRVQDPVALAEWALKGEQAWDRDRILAAMNARRPQRVNLKLPIQVILFYITAVVMPDDGSIHFAEDIYGHDTKLDRALERREMPK